MITNRPEFLLAQPDYAVIPPLPIGLDLTSVPDWIKMSMVYLGGVQPLTGAMAEAAEFIIEDKPSPGEIELHRRRGTRFQIISVVISTAGFRMLNGVACGVPFAISIIPADKRGRISEVDIEYVRNIDLNRYIQTNEPCFTNFNPFTGEWSMFGPLAILHSDKPRNGFADELGLVTDMYYLQLDYDAGDVLMVDFGMGEDRARQKYSRHRTKLMFSPFERLNARRVWGAESPIELFLLQALLRRGLSPTLQMLLFEDGTTYPSLYNLWAENLEEVPGFISEVDMFFPEQRIAVFCDSSRFHRGAKAAKKDESIGNRLLEVGIRSVRVPGALIVRDLATAADMVCRALE